MYIVENKFIIESELTDNTAGEFLEIVKSPQVEKIVIKTMEISSSVMQILFCLAKEKEIICEVPYLAKYFENIQYIK